MIPLLRITCLALVCWLATLAANAQSPHAPYFLIPGNKDANVAELMPLKSSSAKVSIEGTIARVRLTQHYGNTGSVPIEALYVFPASTRSAVHGMTLISGGRVIAAKIRESAKAKAEYETAKAEKKTAALLEEHRANVFQMSVANLMPGEDVSVEINWTETIPALDGTYEFVFPTVVGPRYTGGSSPEKPETWTENPYLKPDAANPTPPTLAIEATLQTALPLAECTCPSHPATVDFHSKDSASVKLEAKIGEEMANRDFILRWKLGGNRVDAGLLLHKGQEMNHFLLQIEPPKQVAPEQIPPRDYVMVLDVSGSMAGFPLETAKSLLRDLVQGLKPTDTFNVLCFASGSGLFSEKPLPATPENLELAKRFIDGQRGSGGTELEAALKACFGLPGGEDRSRSILLVTDGFVSADEKIRDFVRENIGSANLFAFGIGSSVNRELIEGLSRVGGGEPAIVTTGSEAGPAAARFLKSIASPVLAKIRVEAEGVTLGSVEPSPCGDVFSSRPLIINGTWSGEPQGDIVLRGIAGNGEAFEKRFDLAEAAKNTGTNHPALPVLWARERVRHLTEQASRNDETTREITSLGLSYSLLTPFTSFVAVDETPREIAQAAQPVKQPLPLPQGVAESAIGEVSVTASSGASGAPFVKSGSVPEPGTAGLLALLVLLFSVQRACR